MSEDLKNAKIDLSEYPDILEHIRKREFNDFARSEIYLLNATSSSSREQKQLELHTEAIKRQKTFLIVSIIQTVCLVALVFIALKL